MRGEGSAYGDALTPWGRRLQQGEIAYQSVAGIRDHRAAAGGSGGVRTDAGMSGDAWPSWSWKQGEVSG